MNAPIITSPSNQLVKRIRRLKQKKYRQAEGAFFVEGTRLVAAAIESGAVVERLIWADTLLTTPFGRNLINTTTISVVAVTPAVFQAISDRENPIGIAAIVQTTIPDLSQFIASGNAPIVALCNIGDPGNLGTILRTADAAGAQAIVLVGTTVDPLHPSVLKASMGAFFNVPLFVCRDEQQLYAWCADNQARMVATSARAVNDYTTITTIIGNALPILLMGSEQKGLSADVLHSADYAVSIPMHGASSSLNLAVATGLLLYEFSRP